MIASLAARTLARCRRGWLIVAVIAAFASTPAGYADETSTEPISVAVIGDAGGNHPVVSALLETGRVIDPAILADLALPEPDPPTPLLILLPLDTAADKEALRAEPALKTAMARGLPILAEAPTDGDGAAARKALHALMPVVMEADAWLILPARERAGNPAQARDNELTRNLAQIFAYRGRGEAAHAHATADAKRGPAPDAESDASQDLGIFAADAAYRDYLDAEVANISRQIEERVRSRFELPATTGSPPTRRRPEAIEKAVRAERDQ